MQHAAIVVAAGAGERFGGGAPKQFRLLLGRPVLAWSVEALADAGTWPIIVVAPPGQEAQATAALSGAPAAEIVAGGATRTASVRAGLSRIGDANVVLVHDAARPGLRPDLVRKLAAEIEAGATAVAPALAVADALVRTGPGGAIVSGLDRNGAMAVQTPQAFDARVLIEAYEATGDGAAFDDELSLLRSRGVAGRVIAGDRRLMKLTYPEDMAVLERLLAEAHVTCVGAGFDAHRFGEGSYVTLCGVRIPHDKGLVGHSDADAGWHALVDAILGALGQADIGAHFPPSDPKWKDADSERFLRHAAALARAAGARIVHVDVTLICERPRVGPHREAMRARTAEVLGLGVEWVSVKATTTERMGFIGREEGLAAQAAATIARPV